MYVQVYIDVNFFFLNSCTFILQKRRNLAEKGAGNTKYLFENTYYWGL